MRSRSTTGPCPTSPACATTSWAWSRRADPFALPRIERLARFDEKAAAGWTIASTKDGGRTIPSRAALLAFLRALPPPASAVEPATLFALLGVPVDDAARFLGLEVLRRHRRGEPIDHLPLADIHFHDAGLAGANLAGALLDRVSFTGCALDRVVFARAVLREVTIQGGSPPGLDLSGATVQGLVLAEVDARDVSTWTLSGTVLAAPVSARPDVKDAFQQAWRRDNPPDPAGGA